MQKSRIWKFFGKVSTKRGFDPSLFVMHIEKNNWKRQDIREVIADRIIKTAEFEQKHEQNKVMVSNIVLKGNKCSDKAIQFNENILPKKRYFANESQQLQSESILKEKQATT